VLKESPFRYKLLVLILFALFAQHAEASKIEKAYQALKIYDYFKAKKCFERSLKKHPAAASYGLATIYYRSDNPFHNLDSSYRYIVLADSTYQLLEEERKTYYASIAPGLDYVNIILLKTKVSSEFFKLVAAQNTITAYDDFLQDHPWANEFYTATHRRDSIAYSNALKLNTSKAVEEFMKTYPYSEYFNRAKVFFEDLQYTELTKNGSVASYLEFISRNPKSYHVQDAEDQIYYRTTENNTIEAYSSFVKNYPHNRNVGAAWRKIYELFMSTFSETRIDEFRVAYPHYPYVEELEVDIKNFKLQLLPFNDGERYGFMDYNGHIVIPPQYEQAAFFNEGLALVMKDEHYGFIDKGNKLIVPFIYASATDFENGRSVVELDEKYGMIDRSGKQVFPIAFKDLGSLSNGLAYGQKDSLYGYYDADFIQRIPEKYEEAFSFSDSVAKVQLGENQAYIDIYGTNVVAPGYSSIEFFSDTLLIFEDNGKYGLMKRNCNVVINAQYDRILKPVIDRTMVIQHGKIGYIDLSGNLIIPVQYETFPNSAAKGQFNSNLTVIRFKGKYGVIDKNGRVILAATFNDLGDISSLMAFSKGKGWGYTDLLGKVVIQPAFTYAESFVSGTAIVELNGMQGVIDSKGSYLLPLQYKSVTRMGKDYLMVSDGSKYGLYTLKAEQLLPVEFESIRQVDKDILVLSKNGQIQYFYCKESRVIQPQIQN